MQVCLYDAPGCTWQMPPACRSTECVQCYACMVRNLTAVVRRCAFCVMHGSMSSPSFNLGSWMLLKRAVMCDAELEVDCDLIVFAIFG